MDLLPQIRIWGPHGQQRLETCKIALLHSTPTGTETLKNLVLGGIASFTVVDDAKCTAVDLGNNFMVGPNSLGEARAKVVTETLQELNESVAGSYIEESPENLINSNPQFFHQFTVVVATQMREQELVKLDEICREQKITLVAVRSYGLMGLLRPSLPEHCVVESKQDTMVDDLRIHQPWPELRDYAMSFDLDRVDDFTHHHIPYVVILIQAAEAWKASHNGTLPQASKDRSAFKDMIKGMKRKIDGVPIQEENFDEAAKAAFHAWTPYTIPSEVNAVLKDDAAHAELGPHSSTFWIMVAALKAFVANEGQGTQLPLDGSIPDMHSTTEQYLKLQHLYRERADQDVTAVQAHLASILKCLGKDGTSIGRDVVRHYCKNARSLRVTRYRPLKEEYSKDACRSRALGNALGSEGEAGTAALYVLLRAADRFYSLHGRFPGSPGSDVDDDVPALKAAAHQLLGEYGLGHQTIQDDYIMEMCRFGAGELHVVAAFIGGMAAQEIIKLVTCQFTPMIGALVFNGISNSTCCFEL
ncbi:hypothetical protein DUNSADRAFT_3617 [Dunaliella salina]|uniref:NEDD8-activating enzyme E1 regulatory subunit n=1 Tax=Dunaliella salina TaxID=3046 RepID=A0ABQ7GTN2_DUNSA|nr:hypothetical protein DUNSADRAFT_3617 [Dunaliella salina]|eukprot:KAF5837956.1 hypothetical protein DUNSADRAFT_3617 [Dunaliella salina]